MLVEIDANKHTENAQNIDFQAEPQYEFDQYQIYGQGRINAGHKIRRKNILYGALRRHHMENFAEDPAQ